MQKLIYLRKLLHKNGKKFLQLQKTVQSIDANKCFIYFIRNISDL
jgi:hypothetical protein